MAQVTPIQAGASAGPHETIPFNSRPPMIEVHPPKRVIVNLNSIARDGSLRVLREKFPGAARPGSQVVIVEPDDEIEGTASVARVDEKAGLVYLTVFWDTLHDLETSRAPVGLTVNFRSFQSIGERSSSPSVLRVRFI